MTRHLHCYCDKCGREVSGRDMKLTIRSLSHAINPSTETDDRGTVDLCDRCTIRLKDWIAERIDG